MRVLMGIDGWCGPVGAGCLWPLDEICESSPKFVMQEQSAWTEKKPGQERKWHRLPKHGQKKDWQTRPKHGQKRSVDRTTETRTEKKYGQKKWQTRPKYGHNWRTDRKSEKTRPKTWTEKAEKVRNTTERRTENVANTTEIWTENLTTTICCERNWVVSFLLKEQNKQTNKTQKDKQRESLNAFFSLLLAMSPTTAFLLLLRPSLAGGGFNSRAFAGVHAYSTIAFTTAVIQIWASRNLQGFGWRSVVYFWLTGLQHRVGELLSGGREVGGAGI